MGNRFLLFFTIGNEYPRNLPDQITGVSCGTIAENDNPEFLFRKSASIGSETSITTPMTNLFPSFKLIYIQRIGIVQLSAIIQLSCFLHFLHQILSTNFPRFQIVKPFNFIQNGGEQAGCTDY